MKTYFGSREIAVILAGLLLGGMSVAQTVPSVPDLAEEEFPETSNRWQLTGPEGMSSIDFIAMDPGNADIAYVGFSGSTGSGGSNVVFACAFFKTKDRGQTWERIAPDQLQDVGEIRGITIEQGDPSTVYIVTSRSGLLRSRDGGATWENILVNGEQLGTYGDKLLLIPGKPGNMLVQKRNDFMETRDGGGTWKTISSFDESTVLIAAGSERIYREVGWFSNRKVYVSDDNGGTWERIVMPEGELAAFAVSGADEGILFTAAKTDGVVDLFRSEDAGQTWTKRTIPEHFNGRWLFADERDVDRLLIANEDWGSRKIQISEDGGQTWSDTGEDYMRILAMVGGVVYGQAISSVDELYRSDDYGRSWERVGDIPRPMEMTRVVVDTLHPWIVFGIFSPRAAYTSGGGDLYRSDNYGRTWEKLSIGTVGANTVMDIVLEPGTEGGMYAAVRGWGGLYHSADFGESWEQIWDFPVNQAESVIIDPGGSIHCILLEWDKGILRSDDGGATWAKYLEEVPVELIAFDPNDPATMYVAGKRSAGENLFLTSKDSGETWTKISASDIEGNYGQHAQLIEAILVHPDSSIYLGTDLGIFRSQSGGRWWELTEMERDAKDIYTGNATGLVVAPGRPDMMFAVGGIGIYVSLDRGENWSLALNGIDRFGGSDLVFSDNGEVLHAALSFGAATMRVGADFQPEVDLFAVPEAVEFGTSVPDDGEEPPDPDDGGEPVAGDDLEVGEVIEIPPGEWHQIGPWTPLGTDMDIGREIAFAPSNPDIMYVPSGGKLYRTQDGGSTWDKKEFFVGGGSAALAVSWHDPDTIFHGAYGGVFRSEDGGDTWKDINTDISRGMVVGVATDPHDGDIIFAGLSDMFGGLGGVVRTMDGGVIWERVMDEGSVENITMAIDVGRVYISVAERGVYYSEDGGDTWTQVEEVETVRAHGDLFVSGDGTVILTTEDFNGKQFAVSPVDLSVVYKSDSGTNELSRSEDGGQTWERVWETPGEPRKLIAHPDDKDRLYVGVRNQGIFETRDGGQTWNQMGGKVILPYVFALAIDPQRPQRVYVAKEDGAFRSITGGGDWERMTPSSMGSINTLLVDPDQSSRIYVVGQSIYVSEDGGDTWETAAPRSISISTLKATSSPSGPVFFATGYYQEMQTLQFFRSLDRGKNWELVQGLPREISIRYIQVDPLNPGVVYVAVGDSDEQGIFASSDQGETWQQIDNTSVYGLSVRGRHIYAIRNNRLYRSNNRGLSWVDVDPVGVNVGGSSLVQINPANPDIVYCYGSSPHDGSWLMARSIDGGTTWEEFPMANWVYGIVVDPVDPSMVYARTYQGVLKADFDDPEYQEPDDQAGAGEEEEALRDPRRAAFWQLFRTINLGPKAGNGAKGVSMVIDQGRRKAYIGNEETKNISIVNLDLNAVTGVIDLSEHFYLENLDLSESLGELYVNGGGVFDLRTNSGVGDIPIGAGPISSSYLDESSRRLYLGRTASVTVVDLSLSKVIEQIPLTPLLADVEQVAVEFMGISGLALDREAGKLYASNTANKLIEIIDLENFQIEGSIALDYHPVELAVDPVRPFLYASMGENRLLRIDRGTGGHDSAGDIQDLSGRLLLDAESDRLWVANRSAWGGGLVTIGLESFQADKRDVLSTQILSLEKDLQSDEILAVSAGNLLFRLDSRTKAVRSVISIGADPRGIAVSETNNQVYVSRGEIGGFSALDASGNIIRTVEGAGGPSGDILVVDEAQRLFLREDSTLVTYELPSFKLLRAEPIGVALDVDVRFAADPTRRILWVPVLGGGKGLHRLDLLTGARIDSVLPGGDFQPIIIGPGAEKAYLVLRGWPDNAKRVGVLDLESKEITGYIDVPSAITNIEVNEERNQVYLFSRLEGFGNGQLSIVDATLDEIVETVELQADFYSSYEITIDEKRGKAYLESGQILDLETLSLGDFYTSTRADFIAFNRPTNTLYTILGKEGLSVYLGPAGTEVSPPPPPETLQAVPGDQEVRLSWQAVQDSTLVGYNIYRRDREDSDFNRITRQAMVDTSFADIDLINDQTYAYQITSVGQGNLESVIHSPTVTVTPKGGGNFRILLLRKSVAIVPGDSLILPISIESVEGFDDEIALSVAAPTGVEFFFPLEKVVPPRVVGVTVRVAEDAPVGRFNVTLKGEGGERSQSTPLLVEVTERGQEESVLTLELDQEEVPLDVPLQVNGRLFPGMETQVQLDFRAERADTLITRTVDTDPEGGYRAQFLAPFTDKWNATASWVGNDDFEGSQSRTAAFRVTSGKTRITATSDLADDADLGWIATLKGRIYPSPGTVAVTINVRKPDKSEETIEGVLSGAEGFYGHDLRMDQQGLWEIWTSWKGNSRFLGATSSVMAVPVQSDVGRVIVLACGQDSPRDIFWPTSNYLANLAYRTFQKRRLLKEKVFYLNDRQEQDVDRDGFMEDVDGTATMTDMSAAWTWAKDRVNADNPLFLYLVGKGTPMGLEVSPGEMLTAMQLGQELTALEEATGSSATLIVDAAHAGNFIRDLSQQGRQVIASTGPGLAFYQAEGYMSFSQYFLTDLYQGKSLQEAFLHTHNILRNLPGGFRDQRPGLEAEGNVIANQPGDYLQTMDAFIGAPFELGDLSPQIKASSLSSVAGGAGKRIVTQTAPISEDGLGPRLKLARPVAEQGVEISARIDDAEGNLKVVRAMIIPPESDSLSSLTGYPEVELAVDADGQWRGVYAGFLKEGVYPVIIYAIDGAGNSAEPLRTTVLVEASETPGLLGDFNGDGLVDFADFFMFADAFGGDDPAYDLDQSGLVDFGDFFLFADAFGGPLGKLLELAEEMLVLPTSYALGVPYPNPFNSEVVVKYSLPREGDVELVVYNTLGQVVRRLVEGQRRLGHHRAVWDGRDDDGRQLATGMYIMWMRAGDFIKGHKVVLVK